MRIPEDNSVILALIKKHTKESSAHNPMKLEDLVRDAYMEGVRFGIEVSKRLIMGESV